MMKKIQNKN